MVPKQSKPTFAFYLAHFNLLILLVSWAHCFMSNPRIWEIGLILEFWAQPEIYKSLDQSRVRLSGEKQTNKKKTTLEFSSDHTMYFKNTQISNLPCLTILIPHPFSCTLNSETQLLNESTKCRLLPKVKS